MVASLRSNLHRIVAAIRFGFIVSGRAIAPRRRISPRVTKKPQVLGRRGRAILLPCRNLRSIGFERGLGTALNFVFLADEEQTAEDRA